MKLRTMIPGAALCQVLAAVTAGAASAATAAPAYVAPAPAQPVTAYLSAVESAVAGFEKLILASASVRVPVGCDALVISATGVAVVPAGGSGCLVTQPPRE